MNKLMIQFDNEDRSLWLGILAIGGAGILLLSIFTTTSFLGWIGRLLSTLFVMFLPGYAIFKLFFSHLKLSDYPILDRFLASVFFSIASVQTLYFLATYVRTYAFNVDEDVISSNAIAITLAILVVVGAFGAKYYLDKKKAAPTDTAV